MKKLLFLFTIAILLTACSKNDNGSDGSDPISQQKVYKLVKTESYDSNGEVTGTGTYEYTNDQLLKTTNFSDGEYVSSTYNYLNGNLSKIEYSEGGQTDYFYESGLIMSKITIEKNGEEVTTDYTYGPNNNMIEEIQYTDGFYVCTSSYTYNNGNIETSSSDCFDGTRTYHYDNKKSPETLLFDEAVQKIKKITKNNRTHITYEDGSDGNITEYTYNEKGYPSEAVFYFMGEAMGSEKYFYEEILIN